MSNLICINQADSVLYTLFGYHLNDNNYRMSCSINDGSTVVIIGSAIWDHMFEWSFSGHSKVVRYNTEGFVEELPELNFGRYDHGCGGYNTESGARVGIHSSDIIILQYLD